MKKIILFVLMLVLLSNVAFGINDILRVEFSVTDEDLVKVLNIESGEGSFDNVTEEFPYRVLIIEDENVQYSSYFTSEFIQTDPIKEVDERIASIKVPYFGNKGSLVLMHNDSIIYSYDLTTLCNFDNQCNNFEDLKMCAEDCGAPIVVAEGAEEKTRSNLIAGLIIVLVLLIYFIMKHHEKR